ncbi:MAG: PAS domain-containing sensor histidine kinase, partial [Bilophila sp.]
MHNTTFKTRIFLCFLAVILVTMVLPGVYVRQDIKQDGIEETIRSAQREAALIAQILGANQSTDNVTAVLTDLGTRLGFRITYIGLDGTVLADSDSGQHKLSELDNHADRQEVIEALHGTTGVSIRHSNTLDADLVYVALPFAAVGERPAGLIRVAVPLKRVEERIALAESQWFGILALGTVLALLLAFALSARLERSLKEMIRVVEGIAAAPAVSEEVEAGVSHPEQAPVVLNRRRLHIVPGREFRRLARAVNDMADRIEDDLRTIAEHKAQLETILDSMDEGVLVIGAAGRIRLVNPALVRFFPQTVHAVGRLPVEVLPIAELQQALDELLARPLSCSLEGAVQDRLVSTLEVEPTHDTV